MIGKAAHPELLPLGAQLLQPESYIDLWDYPRGRRYAGVARLVQGVPLAPLEGRGLGDGGRPGLLPREAQLLRILQVQRLCLPLLPQPLRQRLAHLVVGGVLAQLHAYAGPLYVSEQDQP